MDFPVSFNVQPETMSETYAGIMTSEAVATRVVDRLRIHELRGEPDPRWYVRFYDTLRDWARATVKYTWDFLRYGRVRNKNPYSKAVDDVLEGLEAEPVSDTYLFQLTATWDEPNVAALIADTAAQVFIDYTLEARRGEEGTSVQFLDQRISEQRAEMERARSKLQEFQLANSSPALDLQIQLKLDALHEFEADRETAIKELREVEAAMVTLERQISEQDPSVHSSTTMAKNPVVTRLEEDVAKYEVEMAGLRRILMQAHPDVQALQAKIDEARRKLEAEQAQVRYQDTTEINQIHEGLTEKYLDRKATREALLARISALDATIGNYRQDVDSLTERKSELSQLNLQLEVLEDEHKLIAREHEEAVLAAAEEISEIRILHRALPPVYPDGPIKIYYAGGGLGIAFLLALGLALLVDYAEPLIRTEEETERTTGAPVLAMVPHGEVPADARALLRAGAIGPSIMWRLLAEKDHTSRRDRRGDS
jgi:uncharacterized protein involved in exopolysaccharide biosynthesis